VDFGWLALATARPGDPAECFNTMKNSMLFEKKGIAIVGMVATVVFTTVLINSGLAESTNTDPPAETGSTSNTPAAKETVELTPGQLTTIKIEPVGTGYFPVEKEALGSIGFDEDPNTVQAESTLIGGAANLQVASNVLERAELLYETNGVSKAELDQDVAAEQTAAAALKAARDAVRTLDLGKTDAEMDQIIAAGKIESAPALHKWALACVVESDSPLIQVGQPVKVRVTAFPDRTFEGKVSKIYTTVDPNTHRMAVRCAVEDPQDELRVGMLANFVIQIQDPVEATAIPMNGVVREGDGTMTVWVTTDRQHFTHKIVKLGRQTDGRYEVLAGLQRGELAVTDGGVFLSNILFAPPSD
jgi:cobalt-zinc-cadmium efflux system membrane fusion protein